MESLRVRTVRKLFSSFVCFSLVAHATFQKLPTALADTEPAQELATYLQHSGQAALNRAKSLDNQTVTTQALVHSTGTSEPEQVRGGYANVSDWVNLGADPIVIQLKTNAGIEEIEVPPVDPALRRTIQDVTQFMSPAEVARLKVITDDIIIGAAHVAYSGQLVGDSVVQISRKTRTQTQLKGDPASSAKVAEPVRIASKTQASFLETSSQGTVAHDAFVAEKINEAFAPDLNSASPEAKAEKKNRLRVFLLFLRNSTWASFIRAAKSYGTDYRKFAPQIEEFGVEIAFRFDLQIGIGHIAFTRNFPVIFRAGYNWNKREVVFQTSVRKEKMSDGFAAQAGVRAEVRLYQVSRMNPGQDPKKREGQAWYPPFILPIFSLVWDKAENYHALGISIGFNVADYVLQSYILNSVNSFQEKIRGASFALGRRAPANHQKRTDQMRSTLGASFGSECGLAFGAF